MQLSTTVSGIKGNPHDTYTINEFADNSVFGAVDTPTPGLVVTRADNGASLPTFWTGTVVNDSTVTFTANLTDAAGNVVATDSVSEFVSCG